MKECTVERVFEKENIDLALTYLSKKKDSCGMDGVKLSELSHFWMTNGDKIVDSVMEGKYEVGIVRQTDILAPTRKKRTISTMNSVDRLLARALLQVISPELDTILSPHCYAYRDNLGTQAMAETAANYIEAGNEWVSEIDVKNYFDSIPQDRLIAQIKEVFSDHYLVRFLESFVRCKVDNDGDIHYLNIGILQGSPLSPLFSNLYLMDFDFATTAKYSNYCRYGDDIRVFSRTIQEAEGAKKDIEGALIELGLRINSQKSGVFTSINRSCLGYEFYEKDGHVYTQKIINHRKEIFSKWRQDSVRKVDHNYHIVNDGILTKKDFSLLFENEEGGKFYLPIETMDSLSVYSGVSFSSNFFKFASSEGLLIDVIDRSGEHLGSFIPDQLKGDYKVEMAQIKLINDEKRHLKMARKLQNANIFNLRAVLRYYERRGHNSELQETIGFMTDILDKVKTVSALDNILMYEAQARQRYYACFNLILSNEEFLFSKRTRRPPQDPLNAMISFGNMLLYTRIANEIYRSSLDIRFGILHNSVNRAESLNLDLADLFKPVLVDRTIFTLINRKMLDASKDFRSMDGGGVYLSENGKKIFIRELERKLFQKIKVGNEVKTYEQLLKNEVRNLSLYFRTGRDYKPYRYVN